MTPNIQFSILSPTFFMRRQFTVSQAFQAGCIHEITSINKMSPTSVFWFEFGGKKNKQAKTTTNQIKTNKQPKYHPTVQLLDELIC